MLGAPEAGAEAADAAAVVPVCAGAGGALYTCQLLQIINTEKIKIIQRMVRLISI